VPGSLCPLRSVGVKQPGPSGRSSLSLASRSEAGPGAPARRQTDHAATSCVVSVKAAFSAEAAARAAEAAYVHQLDRGHRFRALLARRRFDRLAADLQAPGVRERIGAYALAAPPATPAVERRIGGERRQVVRRLRVPAAPARVDQRSIPERRSMMHRRRYVLAGSYRANRSSESELG